MGDIADMMVNGDMCEGCGEWLGEGGGYPRRCSSCGGGPTHEVCGGEEEYRGVKRDRVKQAEKDFKGVALLASRYGFQLLRHSREHYSLRSGAASPDRWQLDLYPGKCRIWSGNNKGQGERPPLLKVKSPWTLKDVVEAAAKVLNTPLQDMELWLHT